MKLSVICVAYKRYSAIQVLINCFKVQTRGDWELIIIHDGPDDLIEKTVCPYCYGDYHRIKLHVTDERYNDWGHSLRDRGIGLATGDWVLQTNDDNYYVPTFVEDVLGLSEARPDVNMIGWDMIHNYPEFGPYCGIKTNLSIAGPTEMGAFAAKTELVKEVGFRHRYRGADQGYLKDILDTGKTVMGKIERILFVHN